MDDQTDIFTLLDQFHEGFPAAWREDRWYLTAVCRTTCELYFPLPLITKRSKQIGALIGIGKASHVGDLYTYLIAQPAYSIPSQRQHLIRRMREAMIKCIILTGIPSVIEALGAVAKLEKEEDKDYSFSRFGETSFI